MTGLLKIHASIDKKTGKTTLTVKENGKGHILEGPIAKRYIGFNLILRDLEDSLWWIQKAYAVLASESEDQDKTRSAHADSIGDEVFNTLKAYYYASIVTYGKCFVSTGGRGIKLEAKDHVDKEYLPCHEKIMGYRNNLVAHAGGALDSGVVVVAPNSTGPEFDVHPTLWRLGFEDDREAEIGFEELIVHVKEKVDAIQKSIFDRLCC